MKTAERAQGRPRMTAHVDLGASLPALQARAEVQGLTVSAVLRGLVEQWLKGASGGSAFLSGEAEDGTTRTPAQGSRPSTFRAVSYEDVPGRVDTARRRVEIKLTSSEWDAARETAADEGLSLNRWIVLGVRARLTGMSELGPIELEALRDASSQLGAVGRNLNQIARSLNTEGVGPDRYPDNALLSELQARVSRQVDEVRQVLMRNQRRWTLRRA